MELYHLQTFVVVVEELSITRAAKRLFTTPSTISTHVKALEDELGVQLFIRTNHGMVVTVQGKELVEKAIAALQSVQNLVNHAAQLRDTLTGTVSIGLCSDPAFLRVPELIRRIQAKYTRVDLVFEKLTSMQIVEAVTCGQLDLGFVFGEVISPVLTVDHLMQVELVVAVPSVWQASFDNTDWRSLASQRWVSVGSQCPFQKVLEGYLDSEGLTTTHRVQVDDERSRYDLVKAGVGLSLLERHAGQLGVTEGVLSIAPVTSLYCNLSLICRTNERAQPVIHLVAQLIADLVVGQYDH